MCAIDTTGGGGSVWGGGEEGADVREGLRNKRAAGEELALECERVRPDVGVLGEAILFVRERPEVGVPLAGVSSSSIIESTWRKEGIRPLTRDGECSGSGLEGGRRSLRFSCLYT